VDGRLREDILQLVENYRRRGDGAILAYDDKGGGVRSNVVCAELAAQASEWLEYPSELRRYLTTYPSGRPRGARDFLYWTEARSPKVRPTLAVHHAVSYAPSLPAGAAFVAIKQLYASHYLEGAFELRTVVEVGSGERSTFLLVVRAFRFDRLPGGVLDIRDRVREQFQAALRSDLERYRDEVEGHRQR
jgi:hypothetical protein